MNMNLTLTTHDADGYYEEYKAGQKFSVCIDSFVDASGNTVKKSDLVRRKWLDNDFYGAIYSANYNGKDLHMTIGWSEQL